VTELRVNNSIIPKSSIKFSKHRLYIPHKYLQTKDINKVEIKFENEYVRNSAGLHKFVDPADS
jgi:hypothetical protein